MSQVFVNAISFTTSSSARLAEEVFELGAGAGFGVAVFDDYGAGERESPLFAGGMRDGARAGDDDRILRDDQRLVVGCRIDGISSRPF